MRHRYYDDLLDDYYRALRVDPLLLDREWIGTAGPLEGGEPRS